MNSMEDQLWDYLDGFCSPEEKRSIEQLIQTNAAWKRKLNELTALHESLKSMELDEPSMAFKNRVMEQVLASPHPSTLKTRVDKRIINSIGGFFAIAILGVLGYTFSKMDWSVGSGYSIPSYDLPKINWSLFDSSGYTLFVFTAFMVTGLFVVDKVIQERRSRKTTS